MLRFLHYNYQPCVPLQKSLVFSFTDFIDIRIFLQEWYSKLKFMKQQTLCNFLIKKVVLFWYLCPGCQKYIDFLPAFHNYTNRAIFVWFSLITYCYYKVTNRLSRLFKFRRIETLLYNFFNYKFRKYKFKVMKTQGDLFKVKQVEMIWMFSYE